MNTRPIVCLMGPTASGKTALALSLVDTLPCDIVSVDSAMIYRGMDIGTAKPSPEQLARAPHRLIDILDPAEAYSVGQFCLDAASEIQKIWQQGRIPLLVGGTMMYFHMLQRGLSVLPGADMEVRGRLLEQAEELGWEVLHERLTQIDPVAGARISINDRQRIQRALEIYELTGQAVTDMCKVAHPIFPRDCFLNIALLPEDAHKNRHKLHENIALRFREMLRQGLVEEVRILHQRGDLSADMPSLRAVGYRQVWEYLEGDLSADEMEEKAIIATRQLAKRQLTWLRRWSDALFFDADMHNLSINVRENIRRFCVMSSDQNFFRSCLDSRS